MNLERIESFAMDTEKVRYYPSYSYIVFYKNLAHSSNNHTASSYPSTHTKASSKTT